MKLMCASLLVLLIPATFVRADILVIAGAQSPIRELTRDEVGRIFLKRMKQLPGRESLDLYPVGQSSDPAFTDSFYLHVTGKDRNQLRAYWARLMFTGKDKPPKDLKDDEGVKQWVTENPGGVGFIRGAALTPKFKVVYRFTERGTDSE